MSPVWLLLLLIVPGKKGSSSSSSGRLPAFDKTSVIVELVAGDIVGQLYTRPRVGWIVRKGDAVIGQGTSGGDLSEPARPLLEAFTAATPGLPITAYFSSDGHVLTIAVYLVPQQSGKPLWGWTATDGVQVANGLDHERGPALLAALDRAEDGGAGMQEQEATGG